MSPEVDGAGPIDWGTDEGGSGGANSWPDPSTVVEGTEWLQGGVLTVGTKVFPTPAAGVAGTCDLNALKELIRFILDAANVDGADPLDLSANMVNRVGQVLKVNPEKIRPDANLYSVVTVFTGSKQPLFKTIAKDQVNGKRQAKIELKIVGMVWNQNMTTYKEDPADNDLEYLMENIEAILRHYASLNSLCLWQIPTAITYHSSGYDEQTHLRVGIMNLEVTTYY